MIETGLRKNGTVGSYPFLIFAGICLTAVRRIFIPVRTPLLPEVRAFVCY